MKKDRVTSWNSLETQIKQSSNINPFKTNISTEEEVHYIYVHMYSMYLYGYYVVHIRYLYVYMDICMYILLTMKPYQL